MQRPLWNTQAPLAACGSEDGALDEDATWAEAELGSVQQATICGTNDFQNVEFYNGNLGLSIEMVDQSYPSVAQTINAAGTCTATLIARDIMISAGHCGHAVGDEVRFNHQLTITGFPRDPVVHAITEIIAQKNDVSSFPESGRGDFAVFRVSGTPGRTFGYLRIANEEARTVAHSSQPLGIIGHPGQGGGSDYKVVSAGAHGPASPQLLPNWFSSLADTLPGSSGAGVLRRDGQIVGVHTTQGPCSGGIGNNNMRMPVLFREIPMLRQISSMQGVSFANLDNQLGVDAIVVNFNRISARLSNGSSGFVNQSEWTSNAYFGFDGTFFADVTGDRRADAISVNNGLIVVRRSQANNTFAPNETWLDQGVGDFTPIAFADVTGDGVADMLSLSSSTTFVRPSTGNAFGPTQLWRGHLGSLNTIVADVGGNQAADIISIDDDRVRVRLSNFSNFGSSADWTSNAFFGAYGTFLADVTGDGKADLIAVNNSSTTVRRSTGSSFGPNETWLSAQQFGSLGITFADADGDGDADFIAVNPSGITVRKSSRTAFGAAEAWVNTAYFGAR